MTRMEDLKTDLSTKNGSLSGALISFFVALITFVIAPYAVFLFVTGQLDGGSIIPSSIGSLSSGGGIDADELWVWVERVITYSFPLVILSLFIGFYRAGSYARIPFRVIFALYTGCWLWIASNGGIFTLEAGGATLGLDIRYIIYVMIMISFAMIFVAFSEFSGNRKKYLEAIEKKKDAMAARKARRLSE